MNDDRPNYSPSPAVAGFMFFLVVLVLAYVWARERV